MTEPELRKILQNKPNFVLYDGFEPSGRMHIAQGVFKAMNVNKCTAAGGTFIFWVADWFALMNDKMGGDLERIKTVGQYLIQVWTAAGMDMTREGQVSMVLRGDHEARARLLDAVPRHRAALPHRADHALLPDYGAARGLAHRRADPLPDHAVHRYLLSESRHLPVRRRPAQGQHARSRVLRLGRSKAEADHPLAPHALRPLQGPGEDVQIE